MESVSFKVICVVRCYEWQMRIECLTRFFVLAITIKWFSIAPWMGKKWLKLFCDLELKQFIARQFNILCMTWSMKHRALQHKRNWQYTIFLIKILFAFCISECDVQIIVAYQTTIVLNEIIIFI